MPDVTQEVWSAKELLLPEVESHGIGHTALTICLDHAEDVGIVILQAHGTLPRDDQHARALLAARAPTFFRLLDTALQQANMPADLEEVIRLNLHRASPDTHPIPSTLPRRNAWEKLLDDDVV